MQRILAAFIVGLQSLGDNVLSTILSSLGVVFGVGAVVAMLSVGEASRQAAIDQVRALGAQTVWLTSVTTDTADERVTLDDVRRAASLSPNAAAFAAFRTLTDRSPAMRSSDRAAPQVIATLPSARDLIGMRLLDGRFISDSDIESSSRVCVIGDEAARSLKTNPNVGDILLLGNEWFSVVGIVSSSTVASRVSLSATRSSLFAPAVTDIVARNPSNEIYVPFHPAIAYPPVNAEKNRSLWFFLPQQESTDEKDGILERAFPADVHSLVVDGAVIRFDCDECDIISAADRFGSILSRIKGTSVGYRLAAPLAIIKKIEETRRLFNLVLGSIAAISLLVGGIGIMNIMTASVARRTNEIGVRRAMGARRSDIAVQFLSESILISIFGAAAGIALGIASARVIQDYGGIPAAVSTTASSLSAALAIGCGIVFGLAPAIRASRISPAEAIRQ